MLLYGPVPFQFVSAPTIGKFVPLLACHNFMQSGSTGGSFACDGLGWIGEFGLTGARDLRVNAD